MLTFEEVGHVYRFNGGVVPSVTQILRPLESFASVPEAILEAARDFGANVHLACHLDNIGQLDEEALDDPLRPFLAAWRKFRENTGFAVTGSEVRLYHPNLSYAGTADAIGSINGRLAVVDLKSGVVPATVGPQLAAYQEAAKVNGAKVTRRVCVQLNALGNYRVFEQTDPADFSIFISCLNLNNWLTKRNRTYGHD